jgi:hypothetical protein
LLVAGAPVASALKNEALSVVAEVRFSVLATVRQLADVAKMGFSWLGRQGYWPESVLGPQRSSRGHKSRKDDSKFYSGFHFGRIGSLPTGRNRPTNVFQIKGSYWIGR